MSDYSSFSPYYKTPLVSGYLDVMTFRDIPGQIDDILFEIVSTYEFRPDLLAHDLYQETRLWWVFAMRNKDILKDPVYDMTAGTKIYLPKLSVIKRALGV
jgi:hypothetical protein